MAALITADADATMAADVITDVDVTVDGDFQAEIIPAVISSGSSSFCACAETITADAAMAAADVATVTSYITEHKSTFRKVDEMYSFCYHGNSY